MACLRLAASHWERCLPTLPSLWKTVASRLPVQSFPKDHRCCRNIDVRVSELHCLKRQVVDRVWAASLLCPPPLVVRPWMVPTSARLLSPWPRPPVVDRRSMRSQRRTIAPFKVLWPTCKPSVCNVKWNARRLHSSTSHLRKLSNQKLNQRRLPSSHRGVLP